MCSRASARPEHDERDGMVDEEHLYEARHAFEHAIAAQAPALEVYVGEEHDRQPRERRPAPGDKPGQAMFGERGLGGFHARQCTPARARSNPRRSIRAFSGAKLLMGLEVGRRVSSGLKALITRFWRE